MRQNIAKKLAAAVLIPVLFCGCTSNTYQPQATPMQLAAYAGQANYPYDYENKAEVAPHLFASIGPDSTITIWNAGDEPISNFELWVNKLYTIHVDKVEARGAVAIAPQTVFNKKADTLKDMPANTLSTIQIFVPAPAKLWDVQGPILH